MWNRKVRELVELGTIGEASDETERWRNGKKVEEEAERQTGNIQPDSTHKPAACDGKPPGFRVSNTQQF